MLHICPRTCHNGNGSGNGNGNGSGNGNGNGSGNGNGNGSGNGNGNGNGDSDPWNDDEQPGGVNFTLIGGDKADSFNHVVKYGEGYLACGAATSAPVFISTFSKELKLLTQTSYVLGPGSASFTLGRGVSANFALTRNNEDYIVGMNGYTAAAGSGHPPRYSTGVMSVKGETRDCIKGYMSTLFTSTDNKILSLKLTPKDFTGAAEFIATGYHGAVGFICSFDKDINVLSSKK